MTTENPVQRTDVDKALLGSAGQGIANPIGAVWSAAMMLEHLGHTAAAEDVVAAMEVTLASADTRTSDLGGRASTAEVTDALVARLTGRE